MRAIRDFPWDYVVLQEKAPTDSDDYFNAARHFMQAIAAAHAKPMIFTQFYQEDPGAQNIVDGENAQVARAFKMRLIPNSTVWYAAMAGDSAAMANVLFWDDGFHPTSTGAYLNALLMYYMITGESPVGLPFTAGRKTIPDTLARRLQRAAATAAHPRTPPPLTDIWISQNRS